MPLRGRIDYFKRNGRPPSLSELDQWMKQDRTTPEPSKFKDRVTLDDARNAFAKGNLVSVHAVMCPTPAES